MKLKLVPLLAYAGCSVAQTATPHSATLTWQDTLNPPTLVTYTVYRAQGLCSGNIVFAKLATGITLKTYVDNTVTTGNYCFTVTASVSGVESPQATPVGAIVPTSSVTGLIVTQVQ